MNEPAAAEGITLEDILREAEAAPTAHETAVSGVLPLLTPGGPDNRIGVVLNDPPGQVAEWVRRMTGLELGSSPTWIRLIRTDLQRGMLLVAHSLHPQGEAELIAAADLGMVLSRGLLRDICRWLFCGLGLTRAVLRIPADRPDLADYARRARFRFEGTACGFYGGVLDAQTWAMSATNCPWLRKPAAAAPPMDTAPIPSLRLH